MKCISCRYFTDGYCHEAPPQVLTVTEYLPSNSGYDYVVSTRPEVDEHDVACNKWEGSRV